VFFAELHFVNTFWNMIWLEYICMLGLCLNFQLVEHTSTVYTVCEKVTSEVRIIATVAYFAMKPKTANCLSVVSQS